MDKETLTEADEQKATSGEGSIKKSEYKTGLDSDRKLSAKVPVHGKKNTAGSLALEFVIKVLVTAVVVIVLLIWVIGIHVNHSHASYPMIKDGDLVVTYKLGEIEQGDAIAYHADGKLMFGRVVAIGGDQVDISDQLLTVNGYGIVEETVYPTTAEGAKVRFPYRVPEEAVFVLNDYRPDVGDSRSYGAIPLESCEGEIVIIVRRRGI